MEKNSLTLKETMKCISSYALGGAKIPHSVSNPVFRKLDDENYAIAAFVFTFDRDMLSKNIANAPSEWILINPNNGELIARNKCSEINFSSNNDATVDLLAETNTKFSNEFKYYTISIFETIIEKYTQQNAFDKELNEAYMHLMLQQVSKGLKPFYKDLNKV